MIYRYEVTVPLIYNRHELFTRNPDMEQRFEFDAPLTYKFKVRFVTFELSGMEEGEAFDDVVTVEVCNVYEPKADNTKVAPELVCEIKGLLVDDEIYARKFAEDITDRICKELSVAFIRHNANRHLFQPRVEAAWSRARFASTDYLPFVEAKRKLLSKDSEGERTIFVEDHMRVRDSIYMTSFSLIPTSEMNLEECFSPCSEAVMYLMNEYYSALGTGLVKSKFFHLFSMIEFCEREYCAHNGAKGILDEKSIDAIMDILNEQDIIKNIGAEKDKAGDNKAKRENVLSIIKKSLTDANDIGRNKKLLNILHWMGIESYKQGRATVNVDEAMIRSLTKLRNKSFHGTLEEEKRKSDGEYREAVVKLMYICELILDFVRKSEQAKIPEDGYVLITGKS